MRQSTMPGATALPEAPATIRVPGAAGPALARWLRTASGDGRVVHAGATAVYVAVGRRVVGVTARGAVHPPAALRTALHVLPGVRADDPAEVRGGTVHVGGLAVGVARLVAMDVPRLADPWRAGARLAAALPDLAAVRRQLPAAGVELLAAGDPAAVPMLLGRGDGLTPVGDDVLAGWLVTARAARVETAPIAHAVRAGWERTTKLSATLLDLAAEGECLPQFRALALSLADGRDVAERVADLLAVGHTSGAGMLLGAGLALSRHTTQEASHGR